MLKRLDGIVVGVLKDAWKARASALKATRQEEKTPQIAESNVRRAQDASLTGEFSRRLHKGGE